MDGSSETQGFLEGLQVLDLTEGSSGFCTRLLAHMGARVVKIERPGGEASRWEGLPYREGPVSGSSLSFCCHNADKLGVTLNLDHHQGRNLFLRLADKSDAVVESFPPGRLEALGIGFGALHRRNPRLVLASITGFGQRGPGKYQQWCDLVACAAGGWMSVTGASHTLPLKPHGEQSVYTAGLFAAVGILLALRRRKSTGQGEHVDLSVQHAVAATLEHVMVRYFHDRTVARRQGALHWDHAFCVLPCRDGFMLVTLRHQWETLVEWMESEGMAADLPDPRWRDVPYRIAHLDHVLHVMEKWTRTRSMAELFETAQLMGFPWAPVHRPQEVVSSPQLTARGFFTRLTHPETGACLPCPGIPLKTGSGHTKTSGKVPRVGEDNLPIFQGELGLTDEQLERLASQGVV